MQSSEESSDYEREDLIEDEITLIRDSEQVLRDGEKKIFLKSLQNHCTDLRPSSIHGTGVFAIRAISKGTEIFEINQRISPSHFTITEEELSSCLPKHVQDVIKRHFISDENQIHSIPAHGLSCTLGHSFYLNSSVGTEHEPNVEITPSHDPSGYCAIIASRDIKENEELLDQYDWNKLGTSGRGKKLSDRVEKICRICRDEITPESENVIDLKCNCTQDNLLCKQCAITWFGKGQPPHFTFSPANHDNIPTVSNIFNVHDCWKSDVYYECEICKKKLPKDFSLSLLHQAASKQNANKALKIIHEHMEKDFPLSIKVGKVPGYDSVPVYASKGNGRGCGRVGSYVVQNVRSTAAQQQSCHYHQFGTRNLNGRRAQTVVLRHRRRTRRNNNQRAPPGFLEHKRATFYCQDIKEWSPGTIFEYTAAEKRSCGGNCNDAVCRCPKHIRGMYRFQIDEWPDEDPDDYFSDDDGTVKVNGKSGKELWKPSGFY
jgi:hypothetical protein